MSINNIDIMIKLLTCTLCLMFAVFAFVPHSYGAAQKQPESVQNPLEKWKKVQSDRCKKRENATLGIKLARTAGSFKELSDYVQMTKDTVVEKGKLLGVDDLFSRNETFSIRSANNYRSTGNDGQYNLSGNLSFETKMIDKAVELAELMSEMDYNTTYNHSMSQPRCN